MRAAQRFDRDAPFERTPFTVTNGTQLELRGVLPASDLEEVGFLLPPRVSSSHARRGNIRAFFVRAAVEDAGLTRGDYVLVEEAETYAPESCVLAAANGRYVISCTSQLNGHRVLGIFLGIIRKRGFRRVEPTTDPAQFRTPTAVDSRLRILRGQLGMLESTYARTRNPRLQTALRNEADLVRRKLQNGAH